MPIVERLLLVDNWAPLVHAWAETFGEIDGVEVHESDFFAHDAHAMVSPANSFGIMDGGLDAAIRSELGGTLQGDVQKLIVDHHHGEMPVGTAEVVQTGHKRWPFLMGADPGSQGVHAASRSSHETASWGRAGTGCAANASPRRAT